MAFPAWRPRKDGGFALIAVLWFLILLAFLASSYSGSTRTGAYLSRNLEQNVQAEALADAGIHRVLWELLQFDSDRPLRTDGTVYEWAFGDGRVRFAVQNEAGKIDLNAASEDLLQRLFVVVGADEAHARELAETIADFRDSDDDRRVHGAEAFDYRAAGFPGPKNAPLQSIDEVQQVPGMSAAIFARIRPLITVYTGMAEPDVTVAPAAVRAAMQGATADFAEPGGASAADPADDGPLVDSPGDGGPLSVVSEGQSEDPEGQALIAEIVAIHAEARLPSGAVFAREAIAELGVAAPPTRFYVWRQARRQYFPLERPARPS